jgi:hypothetical protein
MKKIILLLVILVGLSSDTNAQFFKSLLSGIKEQVKARAEKTFNEVKKEVSNKVKGAVNDLLDDETNQLNNFVSVSNTKNSDELIQNKSKRNKQSPSKKHSNLIEPKDIDSAFKNEYPEFYKAYDEIKTNDSQVKEIIFGYPKEHKWICKSVSKSGVIYFDLYYFENSKISERRAIFDLYQMSGYIHHFNNESNKNKDKIERELYVYTYALEELIKYSKDNNNIEPLKYEVKRIEKRAKNENESDNTEESKETNSDIRNSACKLLVLKKEFKDAKDYIKTYNTKKN